MSEEFEPEEEQISIAHSPLAIITLVFLALLFLGAIAFFGYQTWLFVNWILPEDSLMMKILAVVNFDVFSYVWLAVGLFLARWIQPLTRTLAVLAGIITFLLSLACSVVQMMIASAERFGANTDANLVYVADAFIIIALVWNISTLMGIVHIQWPHISGYHPPKKPKNKQGFFGFKKKQPAQQAANPLYDAYFASGACNTMSYADYVEQQTGTRRAATAQERQSSPLSQSPVETKTGSHEGMNGSTK